MTGSKSKMFKTKSGAWMLIWTSALYSLAAAQMRTSLDVRCNESMLREALVNSQSNRKDIIGFCGANFTAYAYNISGFSGYSWRAKASLAAFDMDTGTEGTTFAETSSTSGKSIDFSNPNPDVTSWFTELPPLTVFLQQSECENIVVVARLSVEDTNGTVRYTAATTGRLWCDSSDVDLALTYTGAPVTTVTKAAAGAAVTLPISDSATITANVTGSLKPLANQGCYFATAFFTRHFEMNSWGPYTSPGIDGNSVVLATSCFYPDTVGSVDFRAMLAKAVVPKGLCGSYQLVLLLDALNAAFNEPDKKNNNVTFQYDVSCETEDVCEVVQNGWSTRDARVFLRGPMEETVFQDYGRWSETHDSSHIERYGYGALKVISKYLEDKTDQCKADLTSADAVATKVSETEEIHTGAALNTSEISDLLVSFEQTKTKLNDGNADRNATMNELKTAKMEDESGLDFRQLLQKRIKMGGLVAIINASDPAGSIRSSGLLCHLSHDFDFLAYIDRELFVNGQIHNQIRAYEKWSLVEVMGNLTAVSLLLQKEYPGFDCLENLVKRVIKILHDHYTATSGGGTVHSSSPSPWEEMLAEDLRNAMRVAMPDNIGDGLFECSGDRFGGRWNRCLRKVADLCERCDMEREVMSDDVCRVLTLKKFARDYASAIGLHHLARYAQPENEYDNRKWCDWEPLIAGREVLTFWKQGPMRPEDPHSPQAVMKGHLSPDNKRICWRKKALCTCDACTAPPTAAPPARRRK